MSGRKRKEGRQRGGNIHYKAIQRQASKKMTGRQLSEVFGRGADCRCHRKERCYMKGAWRENCEKKIHNYGKAVSDCQRARGGSRQTEYEVEIKSWNLLGQCRRMANRGERDKVGKGICCTDGLYWLLWSTVVVLAPLLRVTCVRARML